MEGGKALRFSPRHPELLPHSSSVDEILENSQRFFYALKLGDPLCPIGPNDALTLAKREVMDARGEEPVVALSSAYSPDEHSIRDSFDSIGYRVMTFAQVLKYGVFPLAEILMEVLRIGEAGMGCPVELEFCSDLLFDPEDSPRFAILQLRPMSAREEMANVDITRRDMDRAFCVSRKALGNRIEKRITDIVFVKPDVFDPGRTPEIAKEIGYMNARLTKEGRKYVLIGPGRWGSTDRWLGIPVTWAEICGVAAIVETVHPRLHAEPSQGSHFFHNLISLGINYLTVHDARTDRLDWQWLMSLPREADMTFVASVSLPSGVALKVDGRESRGVLVANA
jgi:hypothetical protein